MRPTSPLHTLTLIAPLVLLAACDRLGTQAPPPAPAAAPAAAPAPAAATTAATPAATPVATTAATTAATKGEPSLEVRSHAKQAFTYIGMAKSAQGATREEHIDNALREFSLAIQKDPGWAEAYSNRAVAYMQQRKFNKAEEDLRKARELNPASPSVRYNTASLYSLEGKVDLALDEIDAALARGFTDYDALRRDTDLDNVRRHPEFRKVLEKHKVFIF